MGLFVPEKLNLFELPIQTIEMEQLLMDKLLNWHNSSNTTIGTIAQWHNHFNKVKVLIHRIRIRTHQRRQPTSTSRATTRRWRCSSRHRSSWTRPHPIRTTEAVSRPEVFLLLDDDIIPLHFNNFNKIPEFYWIFFMWWSPNESLKENKGITCLFKPATFLVH